MPEQKNSEVVEVLVTGVSMSGGVKDDNKRSTPYHKNVGIAEGLMQASEVIRETLKTLNEEDV